MNDRKKILFLERSMDLEKYQKDENDKNEKEEIQ